MAYYRVQDSVAVIELNIAPVNALGYNVRYHLDKYVRQAQADPGVTSIVIAGKNNNFSAGADIKEFGTGKKREPWITKIGDLIDAGSKPVVAAINGVALGGGLEVALFCHYRIAVKSARIGFPEVQIGILPGAAGTQRLPRIAGIPNALEMITTGNHVTADKALKMGIINKIVTGNIVAEGIKFARSVTSKDPRQVCLRYRDVKVDGDLDKISEAALAKVKSKYRGYIAPVFCVKSVINSAILPYEAGVDKEYEYFSELVNSNQAAAQRYSFFAERAISRWQLPTGGNYKTAKPLQVRTTGVIGAGTMGAGIALSLITSGLPCILVEQNKEFLDKGIEIMKAQIAGTVRLGKITPEQAKLCFTILKPTTKIEDLQICDLVIEAVYEDLKLKKEIFGKLDKICRPETILCTNTSTLEIDLIAETTRQPDKVVGTHYFAPAYIMKLLENIYSTKTSAETVAMIAEATRRPDKVVGTHFFAPAYIMKLLENIYGTKTSAETVATVMKLGKTIKKVPVLVGSCTGFVANRMLALYSIEKHERALSSDMDQIHTRLKELSDQAQFLVEEGALPDQIDQVLKDFGMPMGTFEVRDLSGIDVGYRIKREAARAVGVTLTPESRFFQGERNCSLMDRLYETGRLGKKAGKGWYKYEKPGGRTPYVDPEVTRIIEDHCRSLGIERRNIGSQEILERMQFAMINEGFKILEDGKCSMPEEIDVIWLYGFTWPKYAGGPMYYASKIGLKKVYERVCYYHKQHPYSMHWVPSALLKKLSETDLPLEKWGEAARGSKL